MRNTHTLRGVIAPFVIGTVALLVPSLAQAQAQTTPRTQTQTTAAADRTVDVDEALEDRIAFRLETNEVVGKYHIDVDVDAGVVTLSGDVASERQKTQALELAKVDGVLRIEDDIDVDADADATLADRAKRGLNRAGEAISDAWITTKVNWFFMGEDALDGSDINVDTNNNVVTLKGTVRSEAGRARAKVLAERTEGVKSVRDELTIALER